MWWGITAMVATMGLLLVLLRAVKVRNAERAALRQRISIRLELLYDPLKIHQERATRLWDEGLMLGADARQGWLGQTWAPHLIRACELLDEHAELRVDDADVEALDRYLGQLRAHLETDVPEPPYPWDILDEFRAASVALRQKLDTPDPRY